MADVDEGGAEAEDVTTVQKTMPTTMLTQAPTAPETATAAGTGIEPSNRTGVATPNVDCDSTQLRKVICMDHGRIGDGGGMEGRCGMSATITERKGRKWNQPLDI